MTDRDQDSLDIHDFSQMDIQREYQDDGIEHQNFNQQFKTTEQLDYQEEKKKQYNEFNQQCSPYPFYEIGEEIQFPMFTEDESGIDKKQSEENISSNNSKTYKNANLASKSTKIKKGLAAETKNIPKNLGLAFQRFIRNNLDSKSKTIYAIKNFLKVPSSQFGKFQFKNYLKNQYLRQLAQQFFGSCAWAREFLNNNKTDLSLYFRYIDEWNSNI